MKLKLALLALLTLFGPAVAEATCDISSAFTAGQVLTAAQLNTLVTDSESCTNNVLNGDVFTGSMSFHSGIDALFYSDTGTTLKASIDAATGHFIGAPSMEGFHTNCGISNSGTTFTIAGYDGTALSASNPCVVAIRSNTAGRTALAYFTANVTLTHGAASDTDGNLFGISEADWDDELPMFGGIVYNGTTPYFIAGRIFYGATGAASALCQRGDTSCDAEMDLMILATGLTIGDWVSLPITRLFWFGATYATAGNAWTFDVSMGGLHGFNSLYTMRDFAMPTGQKGAESGKSFTSTDGATALTFSATNDVRYRFITEQLVSVVHAHDNQSANGADGTAVRWAVPYENITASSGGWSGVASSCIINNVSSACVFKAVLNQSYLTGSYVNQTTGGDLTDSVFANTADLVRFSITYPIFYE